MKRCITLAVAVSAALLALAPRNEVSIWPVDSLIQIFPDDAPMKNRLPDDQWILAARNGHADLQIAVRSRQRIDALHVTVEIGGGLQAEVRRVGYVAVRTDPKDTPASELVRTAPALFPDPLLEDSEFAMQANQTVPVWITLYAPPDANPGLYTGVAQFRSGTNRRASLPFRVRVMAAMVPPRQTLRVTNWLYASPQILAQYYDLTKDPEKYWTVLGNIGRVLAEHHQNVILTPVFELTDAQVTDSGLTYDFTRLDRWVETFRKAGTAQMIEGGHLLGREDGYNSPLTVPVFAADGNQVRRITVPPADPRADAHLRSFLPALYNHLKEKDWLDDYAQHVLDEAHGAEVPVYEHVAQIVREEMPDVLTIDAIDHPSPALAKDCDIWVPQLGTFDRDLETIHNHVAQGGQAWFYTCLLPRGRYLNRFIDFPLLKTRLLQWFNFRYGFGGYLHWGGNSWGSDPFANPQPTLGVGGDSEVLPAGDAFVTYPWREKFSIHSSIRLEAMRDGVEDYELLNALAQRDPAKAQGLAAGAIAGMTEYVRDVAAFRRIQADLLTTASEPAAESARVR